MKKLRTPLLCTTGLHQGVNYTQEYSIDNSILEHIIQVSCTTVLLLYYYCTTLVLLRLEIASFVGIVVVSCELCVSLGHTLKDLLNHFVLVDTILSTSIR